MNILTHERLLEVLDYDQITGIFVWRKSLAPRGKVGSIAGHSQKRGMAKGRIAIRIDGTLYLAHRLAWFYVTGAMPEQEIDHVNMDQSDNRFSNLRSASRSENQRNTKAHVDNTSGLKGVSYDTNRKKWVAQLCVNGQRIRLGRFHSKDEAYSAYCEAAKEFHGGFARVA